MNVALHPQHTNIISLCTGGGGLDLAVELAIPGTRTVCMVEREGFACGALVSAMEAGLMAPAPIWSDARTFNGRPWRGLVDGIIGGIPCQPHSLAGKRRGQEDERDLWSVARRIIVQSGAWFVLIENVRGMLSSGGAERVWRDFQRLGFSVEGGLFRASEVGASHERERLFILAVANAIGERRFAGRDDNKTNDRRIVDATGGNPLADSIGKRSPDWISGSQQPNKKGITRESIDGSSVVADATGEGWQGREPAGFVRQGGQDATSERGGSPLENTPRHRGREGGGQWQRSGNSPPVETLTGQAFSLLDLTISTVGEAHLRPRRSLNPLFVEWLMGWPPGWTLLAWTDLGCSATALCHWKARMRSALLSLGLPREAPPAQLGFLL
ncbi:DNA cytosine methyltransferase [Agrobacterium vitis]|uniref:DNA cytosine methyltransferase n=1 Tax=Agrobacterium vitis TaxID=373 RepID=UPI001F2F1493|nr:DNA cytosine methyltransferase [Agrobacterium vitis]MCF1452281.1 DNA cytosine methyltransferase [Agrobacterium vitis]